MCNFEEKFARVMETAYGKQEPLVAEETPASLFSSSWEQSYKYIQKASQRELNIAI